LATEPEYGYVRFDELPMMLAISWMACGKATYHLCVPGSVSARLAMGGLAFLLLMGAALGTFSLRTGRSIAEYVERYKAKAAILVCWHK
jgi:hypothetical protein